MPARLRAGIRVPGRARLLFRKLIADFSVLKVELEGINHEGVLRCPKAKELTETNAELPSATDKMQRVYVSRRTVRSFMQCTVKFNAALCERRLSALLACVNSYLGICKTRNGHHIAMTALDSLTGRWDRYLHLDKRRMCLVANDGYGLNDWLKRKYHLRLKRNNRTHDKRRKAERPAAHSRAQDGLTGHHGRE